MDWIAVFVSMQLAIATLIILLPLGLWLGRWLAFTPSFWRMPVEALIMLPLVLPPTVMGYYWLMAFGGTSFLGQWLQEKGMSLVFSFWGLLGASCLVNLPFMIQPIQRAFEALDPDGLDAAAVCGLHSWQRFWQIERPLIASGVLSSVLLTLIHTLGEFGVVLMVGGNIEGQTRTLSIAIYDKVQQGDFASAHQMSLGLVIVALMVLMISFGRSGHWSKSRIKHR